MLNANCITVDMFNKGVLKQILERPLRQYFNTIYTAADINGYIYTH